MVRMTQTICHIHVINTNAHNTNTHNNQMDYDDDSMKKQTVDRISEKVWDYFVFR